MVDGELRMASRAGNLSRGIFPVKAESGKWESGNKGKAGLEWLGKIGVVERGACQCERCLGNV